MLNHEKEVLHCVFQGYFEMEVRMSTSWTGVTHDRELTLVTLPTRLTVFIPGNTAFPPGIKTAYVTVGDYAAAYRFDTSGEIT
jgi:hypothetical protein